MIIAFAGGVLFASNLGPGGFIEVGEANVALDLGGDLGQVQALGLGQGQLEQSVAADHADLLGAIIGRLFLGDLDGFHPGLAGHGAFGLDDYTELKTVIAELR